MSRTIILYYCEPFKAKLNSEACKARHDEAVKMYARRWPATFSNGLLETQICAECEGVTGDGEEYIV